MIDFSATLSEVFGPVQTARVSKLKGEVSTRAYYRVELAPRSGVPASLVVMQLPEPFAAGSVVEAQARAFLDVRSYLQTIGIPVPEYHGSSFERGQLLLEDLGDLTFEARLRRDGPESLPAAYAHAVDQLADLHARAEPPQPAAACIAFRRRYDAALLRSELDHFREWGLEAPRGVLPPEVRAELDAHFDALTAAIVALPDGFVHRDYQSRNLMWTAPQRLVVIDFQDAFIGPAPYDLVALLCDSYVTLDYPRQRSLLERYAARRHFDAAQRSQLLHGFDLITLQRKLKDAGRFVFIDRVRNNADFLQFFTPSLRHVARALDRLPEWRPLHELLQRQMPGFPECAPPPPSAG
ncbi:MAG TPA: phosphotransferase [Polyangiales bacterium]|nr:phosphotransferase [Polyangiales bacterium]